MFNIRDELAERAPDVIDGVALLPCALAVSVPGELQCPAIVYFSANTIDRETCCRRVAAAATRQSLALS